MNVCLLANKISAHSFLSKSISKTFKNHGTEGYICLHCLTVISRDGVCPSIVRTKFPRTSNIFHFDNAS
jgi:hypothetical protein